MRRAWLGLALSALCVAARARAGDFEWRAKAQLAVEVDTNAERKEGETRKVDGDTRLLLRGSLSWRPTPSQALQARLDVGTKLFFTEHDQDLFVVSGSLAYDLRLSSRLHLDLDGSVKDRRERVDETAYTNAAGGGALRVVAATWLDVRARAGWSRFVFRADDPSFGYDGDDYSLSLITYPARRMRLSASYSFARRFYGARPFLPDPNDSSLVVIGSGSRADKAHSAELRFRMLRVVLFEASYAFQWVSSNSYGFSYQRHRVAAQVSAKLPFGFYGHLAAALQLLAFRDPIFLDPSLYVEDDNRNSIAIKLSRRIARRVTLDLRWSFFASGLTGDPLYYRRHVAGLGVSFAF